MRTCRLPSTQRSWSLAVLLALVCWAGTVLALDPAKQFHHYVRDTWSIEQGLPQISALAIAQDRQGYLWVGTQAGLARFDGHRFVAYTPDTTPELPGTFINDLLHDGDGRLWIATYKGLAVRTEAGFATVPLRRDGVVQAPNVVALALAGPGTLLAAAGDAVYRVENGELVPLHQLPRSAHALMTTADALWIGSRGGAYRIGPTSGMEFLPLPQSASGAAVSNLVASQGSVWAGTSEGLFRLDGERWHRFTEDPRLARSPIEGLIEDRDGNLWVAEIADLVRLRDGRLHERVEAPETAGLAARALFEDREGNLWLGSQWNGLIRLRNGWTQRFSLREGLHNSLLWSVAEGADGRLWVGSDDGLSVFEDGRFRQAASGSELPHPSAYTLLVEGDTIWIGTRRGLAVLRAGKIERPPGYEPMQSAQINGILRDRGGTLWFATTEGLYRDAGSGLERLAEAEGLADARVRFLLETSDGTLLLGTNAGLYRFDGGRLLPLGLDRGLPAGLDVTAIRELPDNRLVIGTLAEELFLYDGERWTQFGPERGMPSNAPFFLANDAQYLWVGGIRGIQRVPLADLYQVAAGAAERVRGEMLLNERGDRRGGQKGYCCNGAGNSKGLQRGDTLWAPTRDGLVALDTGDVQFAAEPPTTLVERMRVRGTWHDVDPSRHAELPANARDLGFEFTGISFEDPRSVTFRHRLLGYHDDWRAPDEEGSRVVSYTNLPPGEYQFEVQASSVGDRWSEPARVEFAIQPYFRETGGFYGLLGLTAVLLGLFGYRVQRARYHRRARVLEQLVHERTEDLAEANQRLQEASYTDQLTGLRNRRYLAMQIPKDLAFYGRELRRGTSLGQVMVFAIVDIDHFKRINDEHGHVAGDRVLEQFAQVLLSQVRSGDYVARWGGEEFVVVFRPTPTDFVPLLGERIRASVAGTEFDIGGAEPLRVTCSTGLVEYPLFHDNNDSLGWEHLIELADRALYHVKRNGRNGWGAYRPAAGVGVCRVLELLRLDENGFEESTDLELISGHEPQEVT